MPVGSSPFSPIKESPDVPTKVVISLLPPIYSVFSLVYFNATNLSKEATVSGFIEGIKSVALTSTKIFPFPISSCNLLVETSVL